MAKVQLIAIEKCRPGGGVFVEYDGHELGVFLLDDPPYVAVIDNACPHASGNLSAGEVAGFVVTCPSHSWTFDLRSGQCVDSPLARVRRYEAEIRDGIVWADLSPDGGLDPMYWPIPC